MARARIVGIAAGFAAALVLAAAWTLFERVQPRGGGGVRASAGASSMAAGNDAGLAAPPLPMHDNVEREAVAPVPAEAAAEDFETPLAAGRRLRIVRADDGSPVPGAEVQYLGERALLGKARRRSLSSALSVEATLRWHGLRFRADRDGCLFVPSGERAYVDAAGTELWGWRELDRGDEAAVLELERELVLRARVVDAEGRPVEGANVALGGGNGVGTLRSAVTDRDGRARLAGVGRVLERRSADEGISLSVDLVAWEPPRVALDPEHLPSNEVELVLPPTGSLQVRFVGAEGELLPVDAVVSLDACDPAAGPGASGRGGSLHNSARAADGIAHFPLVAVGASVQLFASHFDGRPPQYAEVSGPTLAGEHVVVSLTVDTSLPKLVLHLAQPDGSPLTGARVVLRLGDVRSDNIRWTDDAGGLCLFVTTQDAGRLRSLSLSSSDGGRLSRATVALPTPLAPGENDLGRIELALVTPFAAGRVLDSDGRPVQGAEVVAFERAGDAWRRLPEGSTRSREDGGFALYGELGGERLALAARMPGFARTARVAFAPPVSGVELRLHEAGSLAGMLLLGEAIEPRSLTLDLTCVDAGEALAWTTSAPQDGAFAFHDLPAGLYELRAVSEVDRSTLATIAGLVVAGGAETRDPRLAPWDLRGRVTRIALEVRDSAGEPIDGLRAWMRRAGGDDPWTEIYAVDGSKVELITAEPVIDVLLRAPRRMPVELVRLSASREVLMAFGPTLELVLEGGMPALPPTAKLTATVRSAAPDGGRALVQIVEFDRTGIARLDVVPDEELRLSVQPKTVFGLGSSVLLEPDRLTVPAAGDRVVVRIDREALERALASFTLR